MYLKSLVVFVLCTALVLGFIVVLNYEATAVGNQVDDLPTSQASCFPTDTGCPNFSLVSASLRVENTTDILGVANPAYLSLELNVSGITPIVSIHVFIGNALAAEVKGPFPPGLNRIENLTLMATVTLLPGKTYTLSVEGLNSGGSYLIESTAVTAEAEAPYS